MYRNVLLVDDDSNLIKLVTVYLEQAGYAVAIAKDGYSALDEISKHHFDLILLDKAMPYVNGDQVLKKIRKGNTAKSIPVMMLTAISDKDELARSKNLGADDYVIKPFEKNDLLERIDNILGTRPTPGEVTFSDIDGKRFGQESPPAILLSVGYGGLILKSQAPMKVGTSLEKMKLKFFEEIEIDVSKLNINFSQKREDGWLEFFISFLPLGKNESEKIWRWIESKVGELKLQ